MVNFIYEAFLVLFGVVNGLVPVNETVIVVTRVSYVVSENTTNETVVIEGLGCGLECVEDEEYLLVEVVR